MKGVRLAASTFFLVLAVSSPLRAEPRVAGVGREVKGEHARFTIDRVVLGATWETLGEPESEGYVLIAGRKRSRRALPS